MKREKFFFLTSALIVMLLLSPLLGQQCGVAQPAFFWANGMGTPNIDKGMGVAVDGNGDVLVTGYFQGTADFDPGSGTANLTSVSATWSDAFVAKYSSTGAYLWAFNIGGNSSDYGYSIAVDGNNNVLVTGSFGGLNNTADFDPGAGTAILTCAGGGDVFVAKYSSAGAYQWAFKIGSNGNDEGYSIAVDASNNVLVTGTFDNANVDFNPGAGTANLSSNSNSPDAFVAKYTSAGAYQWAFKIGGMVYDYGFGIAVDGNNDVLVTGEFSGSNIDFNPGAGTANLTSSGINIFIAKYTSAGAYQWAFNIGTTNNNRGQSIAVDGSNNVLVTGYFNDTADFDPGAGIANLGANGYYDIFVAKYSTAGNYQWAFNVGSTNWTMEDQGYGIAVDDSTDNVHITGSFTGTADFDPGSGIANLSSAGNWSIFGAIYSPLGNYICAWTIGYGIGQGIDVDNSGNSHISGYFAGSPLDFDPGSGVANLTSAGLVDVFVAKYGECDSISPLSVSVSSTNVQCNGQCTGTATVTPTGSISPYTYNWSNGTTDSTATGLCAGTYYITVYDSLNDSVTDSVTITEPAIIITNANAIICTGDSIFLQGSWQTTTGVYNDTLSSVNGCDSVISTNLTVNSTATSTAAAAICTGDSIFLQGSYQTTAGTYYDTLTASTGCDSILATTLSVDSSIFSSVSTSVCPGDSIQLPGGNWVNSAGEYSDTLTASAGCDSIIQITLSVNTSYNIPLTASICSGDSIYLQGNYQLTAGTYYDTLASVNGCDSILATTLSVDSVIFNSVSTSICPGDSIQLPGGNWVNIAGVYSDTLTAGAGCDSIIQTSISFYSSYNIPLTALICSGDSIFLQGSYQTASGTYYDTLSSVNGCDSILATALSVDSAIFNSVATSICPGDSVQLPGGSWVNAVGTYYDTLTASAGCDSIIQTGISFYSSYNIPLTALICSGDSIFLQGSYQTASGTYYDTLSSVNGCDSILATALSVDSAIFNSVATSICPGDSVQLPGGSWVNAVGTYYDTLTASAGCDSIIQTSVSLNSSYNIPLTASICSGDSIFLQGNYQTTAGTYYDTLSTVNGCDSILATTLTLTPTATATAIATLCQGDSLLISGEWVNVAGTYYDSLLTTSGCDSIIAISLTIDSMPVVSVGQDTTITAGISVQIIASGGISYLWSNGETSPGITVSPEESTTYYVTVSDANGCAATDSVKITVDISKCTVFVPTIFTPNGDGKNDVLYVRGYGLKELEFMIYDRWGEKVYEYSGTPLPSGGSGGGPGWDGTFRKKELNTAVFVYTLKAVCFNGELIEEKGNITLVK